MKMVGIIGWWWFIGRGQVMIVAGIMVGVAVRRWWLCGSGWQVTSGWWGVVVCGWMQAHAESPGGGVLGTTARKAVVLPGWLLG